MTFEINSISVHISQMRKHYKWRILDWQPNVTPEPTCSVHSTWQQFSTPPYMWALKIWHGATSHQEVESISPSLEFILAHWMHQKWQYHFWAQASKGLTCFQATMWKVQASLLDNERQWHRHPVTQLVQDIWESPAKISQAGPRSAELSSWPRDSWTIIKGSCFNPLNLGGGLLLSKSWLIPYATLTHNICCSWKEPKPSC